MANLWFTCALVVLVSLAVSIRADDDDQEYYWKKLKPGFDLDDALAAGKNLKGRYLYIGKSTYGNGAVVPGFIDADGTTLYFVMDGKLHTRTEGIEILCTSDDTNFDWVETDATGLRFLTDKHLVAGGFDEGGSDDGYALICGRKFWNDGLYPGNARINLKYEGIAFAFEKLDGTGMDIHYEAENFDVLSYDKCKNTRGTPKKRYHLM